MNRLLSATVVALLAATACSERGPVVVKTPRSPVLPSPTFVDGGPCPLAPPDLGLPEGAVCASSVSGTFEEGEPLQVLSAYAFADEGGLPVEWHIHVTRDAGDAIDEPVDIGTRFSYPRVLGAADADGDGLDEVFVNALTHLGHGGQTNEVTMFGVDRGRIFRVRADGVPLLFPVGGVSTFGEGAECRDVDFDGKPEFLLLRVDYVFSPIQRLSERVYEWVDRHLELVRRNKGRMAKTGYLDPLLWRYYSLRCLDFEAPFPFSRG